MNTLNSQIYIKKPREDSILSLSKSYLDLNFEIIKNADNSTYANRNDLRLVNLGLFAFFNNLRLITSKGKHLEDIGRAHIVSLMYELLKLSRESDDLSIRFYRDRKRRRDELSGNKNKKRRYHLRIMLKDVFCFAEHQNEATNGLRFKLTLTRNKDDAVIDKAAGIADARKIIEYIHWYVPLYTPSIQQKGVLSKQILSSTQTELRYIERSIFLKEVNSQNVWNFELGSQESMNVPIWIAIGF